MLNSLNQIVNVLRDIASNHEQLNDFGYGDIWEAGKSRKLTYSCMWANLIAAIPNKGQTGYYSSTTFRLRIFIMDLVNKDDSNDVDVISDSIQILQDILSELNDNPYYGDNGLVVVSPQPLMTPFREKLVDELNGAWMDLDVTVPYNYCYTGLPLTPKS